MPEFERRNKGNKDRYADDYRTTSPLQKSSSFDAVDSIYTRLIHVTMNERGSSKSRDKERKKETDVERDREQDRHREKDRDRERDGDHDCHHRDHKDRERSVRRRCHHDPDDDDYECHCGRDHDRYRDYDREREARSNHRSRSHSSSRSKSKCISGFDMPPPVSAQAALMPCLPASSQTALMPGGLPPAANEQSIAAFFNQVMSAIGGTTGGLGDAVVNVYINHEKKFGFEEMRTVEEASNAMTLDGIAFEGAPVKVRRPTTTMLLRLLHLVQPNQSLS